MAELNVNKINGQTCCASTSCTMAKFARIANFALDDQMSYRCGCDFLSYDKGENIFLQNSPPTGIYCLQSGHVMLWHRDELGNDIGFRVAGAGDIVGHRAFFGEDPHAASAAALTNCVVCHLPKHMVTKLLEKYPILNKLFLRLLALDRGPPDSLLLRNTNLPVKMRLINLLLILKHSFAKKDCEDDTMVIVLPLYRKDISTMIAARHETVARAIKELKDDGLVYFRGRTVMIPDINRLTEVALEDDEV
jgi:CRP-like cAMP-binding protein